MERRNFLHTVSAGGLLSPAQLVSNTAAPPVSPKIGKYPRTFTGKQLAMLAMPLGGIGAGSLSLGGRGQLRDWEIFNRPHKGNAPSYALPAIWAQAGNAKPVAFVLESRYLPPYEGATGLGSKNAPGLKRLRAATFTGEYPMAHIDFRDAQLPVTVSLDAFSPFYPLDADASGLPVAVLSYRVKNPGAVKARVAIAWSIDNPVGSVGGGGAYNKHDAARVNTLREGAGASGILMSNPALGAKDPVAGSFALAVLGDNVTRLSGWPQGRWWNSPLLFWDDFTADGALGPEEGPRSKVGAVCLQREIAPGAEAEFRFLLAWHFPNRTPGWCGWRAPKGDENTVIGNWYATQYKDAWAAVEDAVRRLPELEKRTRQFTAALRSTSLPPAVRDAAMANLSTLASTTCFRTADGAFHGFEGVNDDKGCCFGSCSHVWNYETATHYLFPTLARSLREAAFTHMMDERGAIYFREVLPAGKEHSSIIAADGQMGQVIKAYIDWNLSGDSAWLEKHWPAIKRAMEFCWIPGGWDADRDGVMEGVQHNTYDVEFYGPNPQCGIYYLGALRAAEEMARAVNDPAAATFRQLYDRGRAWIDANLFNGEYYIQQIRGAKKEDVARDLRSAMGSDATEKPDYQVGDGCLVDQLVGQYLADVAGLGDLVDPAKIRKALDSIYRYNYKRDLMGHDSVQRIFAVNDEAALVICDYGKGTRPRIPFPYYAEVMTGFEYCAATHMMYAGMQTQGVECVANIRARYDGERRNPWDEAECGHHYARAMAAWTGIVALGGFRYSGVRHRLEIEPRYRAPRFTSFWSTPEGWGVFRSAAGRVEIEVLAGRLDLRELAFKGTGAPPSVTIAGAKVPFRKVAAGLEFAAALRVTEGQTLAATM